MSEKFYQLVKTRFKDNENNPFILTEGQAEIFKAIATRKYKRCEIRTYTQYGKSDTTAMAILTRITTFPEKYVVISGSDKKLGIIRSYLIGHIFDNAYTVACFEIEKGESLERIRRERNKSRLTFKVGDDIGEVMFLSAEGKRTKDVINATLGFGSPNVIIDDSPLLSDEHYAGIVRMLGGHKDNMLIELGNAIGRNHFFQSSRDLSYKHIVIDYNQGIKEERQTAEFFQEMQRKMSKQLFDSLYSCEFPPADAIDAQGYSPLYTETDLDRAYVDELQVWGDLKLGVDVAGGGKNYSVIVLKGTNGAKILYRERLSDTMVLVGLILRFADQYGVGIDNIFIDVVGMGKGVYDRLNEVRRDLTGATPVAVNFGEKPENDEDFANLKAQCYWRQSEWLKAGAKLERNPNWEELLKIKYKVQSDKKIKIISKEELMRQGIESPDVADALALCFSTDVKENMKWQQIVQFEGREANFHKNSNK